jgi:hypothetical protein
MKMFAALLGCLLLLGFALPLRAQSGLDPQENPYLDEVGRIIRVSAIGGESTGYALKVRKGFSLNGVTVKQIELEPNGFNLRPLMFQQVHVAGPVVTRSGLERGTYLVLVVEQIERAR